MLNGNSSISSSEYPEQIARIRPQRPGILNEFNLHLSGGIGKCKVHIYGHEGGNVIPTLAKDLITPIEFIKSTEGDTIFNYTLPDTLRVDNDQFYIALDEFDGDFGFKQDLNYFTEYCKSGTGGYFYPTYLLSSELCQKIDLTIPRHGLMSIMIIGQIFCLGNIST